MTKETNFENSRKRVREILSNAERIAKDIIMENKDINLESLGEAMTEVREKSEKNRLLLDVSRMNFICNRMEGLETKFEQKKIADEIIHKEIMDGVKAINEKLDGYPLIKNAVIGGIAFILISVFGAIGWTVSQAFKKP